MASKTETSRRANRETLETEETLRIDRAAELATGDPTLGSSIIFSPTSLALIRRVMLTGGSVIADTAIMARRLSAPFPGGFASLVSCFIDNPKVISAAVQRRVTRAEVAVDHALSLAGPKLLIIGSAPAAISRLLQRRQREQLSDVCVIAGPTGFASAVQLKEQLIESSISSVVIRGKKGGPTATVSLAEAIFSNLISVVRADAQR